MEKIILTDCDGCILNWNDAFDEFMHGCGFPRVPFTDHEYSISKRHNIPTHESYKYIKEFNEGWRVSHLKPLADAVEYVDKLSSHGFKFIVVTSISDAETSFRYRSTNLKNVFGDIFEDIICLKMGAKKGEVLKKWEGSNYFWIEDHNENAIAGHELGLRSILVDHPYNRHHEVPFRRVSHTTPWAEIYSEISSAYNLPD